MAPELVFPWLFFGPESIHLPEFPGDLHRTSPARASPIVQWDSSGEEGPVPSFPADFPHIHIFLPQPHTPKPSSSHKHQALVLMKLTEPWPQAPSPYSLAFWPVFSHTMSTLAIPDEFSVCIAPPEVSTVPGIALYVQSMYLLSLVHSSEHHTLVSCPYFQA